MTMDSTTSELMQDNSNELILGQKHNDIDCALCPTAKRAWVTAKQIENWSGMTKGTLRNRLIELEECERISLVIGLFFTALFHACFFGFFTALFRTTTAAFFWSWFFCILAFVFCRFGFLFGLVKVDA